MRTQHINTGEQAASKGTSPFQTGWARDCSCSFMQPIAKPGQISRDQQCQCKMPTCPWSQPHGELWNLPDRKKSRSLLWMQEQPLDSPPSWDRDNSNSAPDLPPGTQHRRNKPRKSQGYPSLQEERASCMAAQIWIGPHQCVIHYWCIHAHLVTQISPKTHFSGIWKRSCLCLSFYHHHS